MGVVFGLDVTSAQDVTFSVLGEKIEIVKIPLEYLPEMNNIGKEGTGEGAEIFNDYENNTALGRYSHAEGRSTFASGDYSHAEGQYTTAKESSHAEGYGAQAYGWVSHAEGYYTYANGSNSHAEGYYTNANSQYQHVQGKYNIEDSANKYAHIVGNGTRSSRKNAHTLDWNGLGWFAGGLKVGGTGQDDVNAVEVALKTDIPSTEGLATESYVDEKIAAIPTPDVSGQIEASVAALVDSAPETLNTLNELANALGDDPNFATTITTQLGTLSKQITEPKDSIAFIDQINGYTYIACMRNGNFVTYCGVKSIEVTTMPTKTEYVAGEYFDPAGMIIVATAYDGTTREINDYVYPTAYLAEGTTSIDISYADGGISYNTTISITVTPFDPAVVLVDFEYTANEDGTYTLTKWKGTYNGEASTELIVPNNGLIIV